MAFLRSPVITAFRSSSLSYVRRNASGLAVAHSSWFKLEDQGMTDYELLARGSAFFIRAPNTGALIALVSAHVAAPHRFRNYFPQDWLQHVRDTDCRTMLENRTADGKQVSTHIMTQPLIKGFRHASLDVAAFLLHEDTLDANPDMSVLELPSPDDPVEVTHPVTIAGFRLGGDSGSGTEAVVSTEMRGTVAEVWQSRVFADTGHTETEMGMCGGPIVMEHARSTCLGILEGLIPKATDDTDHGDNHKRLQGKSVFIHANELRMFLHDIETELTKLPARPNTS